jgi:hypothetical protein
LFTKVGQLPAGSTPLDLVLLSRPIQNILKTERKKKPAHFGRDDGKVKTPATVGGHYKVRSARFAR